MTALEDLLRNLGSAKDSFNPDNEDNVPVLKKSSGAAKALKRLHGKIDNLINQINSSPNSGPSVTEKQELYVSYVSKACTGPLKDVGRDLLADMRAGTQISYAVEFSKAGLLVDIVSDLWSQDYRESGNVSLIDSEIERHRAALGDSRIGKKVIAAADMRTLLRDLRDGPKADMPASAYMMDVHNRLQNDPPDWSPLGVYFPNTDDWQVSDLGVMQKVKKTNAAWLAAGMGAKIAMMLFGIPAFLNPVSYVSNFADFVPSGYLSSSEKTEVNLNGLRTRAGMGKSKSAPFVVEMVYAGRVLSHPTIRERALKDLLQRRNEADQRNQFFVQCFVADLRDDTAGEFAENIRRMGSSNYAVFVYNYPKRELIYNEVDPRAKAFAGWFKPNQEKITKTIDLMGQADDVHAMNNDKKTYIYKLSTLQRRLSLEGPSEALRVVKYHYPNARISNDAIYFISR
ncbi:MAG: hypothetical protein HY438_02400 [DPANN group archaeon]|nr:hypothetical protein [DPANN group archaeon]